MVRSVYVPVADHVFRALFKEERLLHGGRYDDLSVFRSNPPYIRGSGWFTRVAIPLFKKYIAPNLIEFGSNFSSDINSGVSAKSSAKQRGLESIKKTVKKVITGRGRNNRRKMKTSPKLMKRKQSVRKKCHKPKVGGKRHKKNIHCQKKTRQNNRKSPKNTHKKSKCIFNSHYPI